MASRLLIAACFAAALSIAPSVYAYPADSLAANSPAADSLAANSLGPGSPAAEAAHPESAAEVAHPESAAFKLPSVIVRPADPDSDRPGSETITRDQIRRTAATGDDVFRVVQTLPGIASTDFSSSFLVRGGESDETLVRYDGIDLLEPYHIPYWGGAVSVVTPDAVGSMRLLRGGLPARYGRQLSGALEIESSGERPARPRYMVGAGATQLRASMAGPAGGGGSYMIGVRHGLLAALGRLHRVDQNVSVEPDFQDMIGELRLKPAAGQEILLLGLGAREKLRYDMPYDESDLNGVVRNVTMGGSWTLRSVDAMRRFVVSADRFHRSRLVGQSGRDNGVTRAVRGRFENEQRLGGEAKLEWGLAAEVEEGWLALDGIRGTIVNSEYKEEIEHRVEGTAARRRIEGYASVGALSGSRADVSIGVNVARDFYQWGLARDGIAIPGTPGSMFVAPRLSVNGRPAEGVSVWGSMGLMRQPLFLNSLGEDRAGMSLERNRRAGELLLGFELKPAGATLRSEGYWRQETGVGLPIQDAATHPDPGFPLDRGTSRGIEVSVQTPRWRRVDGAIGYAWTRAVWNTPVGDIPRSLDQRHAATLAMNAHPVGRWNLNATARYHSGTPYTASEWVRSADGSSWTQGYQGFMSALYPSYFRLDLRLSHPLPFGQAYLEVINATARRNVHMYTYVFRANPGTSGTVPVREAVDLFPRLPSAGFEVSF
jgi:hypothetical protein